MKKKLTILAICATLALSLVGCSNPVYKVNHAKYIGDDRVDGKSNSLIHVFVKDDGLPLLVREDDEIKLEKNKYYNLVLYSDDSAIYYYNTPAIVEEVK